MPVGLEDREELPVSRQLIDQRVVVALPTDQYGLVVIAQLLHCPEYQVNVQVPLRVVECALHNFLEDQVARKAWGL